MFPVWPNKPYCCPLNQFGPSISIMIFYWNILFPNWKNKSLGQISPIQPPTTTINKFLQQTGQYPIAQISRNNSNDECSIGKLSPFLTCFCVGIYEGSMGRKKRRKRRGYEVGEYFPANYISIQFYDIKTCSDSLLAQSLPVNVVFFLSLKVIKWLCGSKWKESERERKTENRVDIKLRIN